MHGRRTKFAQGYYPIQNKEKYIGNRDVVRYMSSWELEIHRFLDLSPSILQWGSEEIAIEYYDPVRRRVRKYYPDYWVKYKDKKGNIITEVWEVKPSNQITFPSKRGKRKIQQLQEAATYVTNRAKWKAALKYCKQRGWKFRIITEKQLFTK